MPRNSPLDENENGQISANKLGGKSTSFIARELKDTKSYGTRKRPDCPPKITIAARRRLFREAYKGQSRSRYLQESQNLPVTPRRVRRLLHDLRNLVYRNKKTVPALTAKHKKIRVDWVKKSNMDKGKMGNRGIL